MGRRLMLAAIVILLPVLALAQEKKEGDKPGLCLTIYNQNFGVVRDVRQIDLKKGDNDVLFGDVAAGIDGASLHFKSLTDPDGTVVLEQNYEYDLVNANKLLQKYIDRNVRVLTKDGKMYEGTLLGFDGGQIILSKDPKKGPIEIVARTDNVTAIVCSEMPEGLLTKPTLKWKLQAAKAGKHDVKVTYLTSGITWEADYTAVISKDEKQLDLGGWVTIKNNSGKRYEDARMKLVAGGVHRAPTPSPRQELTRGKGGVGSGVEGKEFFEYYLYTMPRRGTVEDKSTKQLELLNAAEIACVKMYRYNGAVIPRWGNQLDARYGTECNKKVDVFLSFKNDKDSHLGMPLPGGRVRVFKKDPDDGSLEMIGEDKVEHTPKDEKVELKMGQAFDIVGERKQTDFRRLAGNVFEESIEIKVRNHKKEKITVEVYEKLYRSTNWEIRQESMKHEKVDSTTIKYLPEIAPDGEVTITYTVMYTR